ncbi:hypothetical protein LSH36_823g01043 [Paralvinella palmiformis]|uniref:Uncharacterized protein n=1 Tax=Paralvinella palmiformis TaxID=53620 RepID=A0AAD9MTV6_9ANNE|nr:hypothetical protein LSH36_823g01043 [Paralvinella palmiformis]
MPTIWTLRAVLLVFIILGFVFLKKLPWTKRNKYVPRYQLVTLKEYSLKTLFDARGNNTRTENGRSSNGNLVINTGLSKIRKVYDKKRLTDARDLREIII